MSKPVECPLCFNNYNKTDHKPMNLVCGHVLCSKCISIQGDSLECSTCCKPTKSTGVMNPYIKLDVPEEEVKIPGNNNKEEFQIYFKPRTSTEKIPILVNKNNTIIEVKIKIQTKTGKDPSTYTLVCRRPLEIETKKLIDYNIKEDAILVEVARLEGGYFIK